jgi:hypothetical protein
MTNKIDRLIFCLLMAAACVTLLPATAVVAEQQYSFRVPLAQMVVTVERDASVRIVYDITFHNNPGAHPIDIVDIGMPHAGYRLSDISASLDGRPLRDIRPSTEVKPGVEVHLDGSAIMPGRQGTLHVGFAMPGMVYQDTTRKDYASLEITPTWFGDQYVNGTTHLQVAIVLPKSVKPDEVLHQGLPFQQKAITNEGTMVGWDWPATRLIGPHKVGVSFPKRDLERVVTITPWGLLMRWFSESIRARLIVGGIFVVLFGLLFFRFSGGTGVSVFVVLSAAAGVAFVVSPLAELLSLPLVAVLIGINEWYLAHRKQGYMPPIAQVEGGGIKRGLTAPEAAALLEMPLAKVLSLVVFGLLKKGVLQQVQPDPLVVEVDKDFQFNFVPGTVGEQTPNPGPSNPSGQSPEVGQGPEPGGTAEDQRTKFYREAGQKRAIAVHAYEFPFLFLLQHNAGKPVKEIDFSTAMRLLLEGTAARMKGFDLRQTQEYYRSIVHHATEQAAAIGDIPQRQQQVDRNFEWILMDDNYPTVFTWPYQPMWTRGFGSSGGSMGGERSASPAGPPQAPSMPGQTSAGDVASSFAGWAENTMGGMASAIMPGSLTMAHPAGGFLNLSGADRVTGEFFQALAESAAHSGGGGGGGGGGCACAGCACACACAGGGR